MKTLFYILTLLMLLSKASFRGSDEGSYVSDLRCEYLTDPLAINDDNPLLGWKIVSDINGIIPVAFRLSIPT